MNVLVVGSGGREHALAWKLRQSPGLTDLFAAPGNPGTAKLGTNLDIPSTDQDAVVRAVRDHGVDLVVVGAEGPLGAGLVDRLTVEGIAAFGPTKAAAEIEWSKAFAKRLMVEHHIPTAPFGEFKDATKAREFIERQEGQVVVKADGLALGKGVVVADTKDQALAAVASAMDQGKFGTSGERVVIEERLTGPEVSAHAFTDGVTVRHMPFSCDHKPVFDDDKGPNTGGMGAYSPATWLSETDAEAIQSGITEATLTALSDDGRPFQGVLYPGVMITRDGPRVIEFNSRFGDPEAQVLLPRMETDLLDVLLAAANQGLSETDMVWSNQACVGVVIASAGYPGDYHTGHSIEGLDDLDEGVLVFHSGTATEGGRLVTGGGRVATVVAMGATLEQARQRAYDNVQRIEFEGMHYRKDIGAASSPAALTGANAR